MKKRSKYLKRVSAAFILAFALDAASYAHVLNCSRLLEDARAERTLYDAGPVRSLARLNPNIPTLVVVDGLSSGADYAVRARELFPKINIVHVQTARRMAPGLVDSFQPKAYDANVVFYPEKFGHLAQLLEPFKRAGLRVVAGAETSPKVRALLTDRLGLPGSSLLLADALNNKYLAASAVSPYVKTIPGQRFSDPHAAWEWAQSEGLSFPIMVKPVDAAGSFGVTACHSKNDFFKAFSQLGRGNPLGRRSTAMLVQPYFSRKVFTEYVIDAVVDTETGVTLSDILEYDKEENNGRINYLTTRLVHLSPRDALFGAAQKFANGVATGLGMKDGLLHIEVFVKNGTFPPEIYFIEAGGRPAGGGIPKFVRACGGTDMITLHLYSMFDREKYLELIQNPMRFEFEGVQVELLGPKNSGIVASIPTDEEFRRQIPGFLSHSLHLKPGFRTGRAQDLFQGPGVINVVGTKAQVDNAEASVRAWESGSDLYRLRNPTLIEWLLRR